MKSDISNIYHHLIGSSFTALTHQQRRAFREHTLCPEKQHCGEKETEFQYGCRRSNFTLRLHLNIS